MHTRRPSMIAEDQNRLAPLLRHSKYTCNVTMRNENCKKHVVCRIHHIRCHCSCLAHRDGHGDVEYHIECPEGEPREGDGLGVHGGHGPQYFAPVHLQEQQQRDVGAAGDGVEDDGWFVRVARRNRNG